MTRPTKAKRRAEWNNGPILVESLLGLGLFGGGIAVLMNLAGLRAQLGTVTKQQQQINSIFGTLDQLDKLAKAHPSPNQANLTPEERATIQRLQDQVHAFEVSQHPPTTTTTAAHHAATTTTTRPQRTTTTTRPATTTTTTRPGPPPTICIDLPPVVKKC
jgi:Asp-tRNA(Asn)/Glu-tRNA(Gln) amidotransferase C subunit